MRASRVRAAQGRANVAPRDTAVHSGILNIDKPRGLTSHDVVAQIRRLSGQRRVGHAGTLDPAATGVLVVCLGRATRIVEYIVDARKVYLARVRFGIETDTGDAEGKAIAEEEASALTLEAIQEAAVGFVGEIEQVPPMYSALKRNGQPLYALARRGITIEREPRPITIYALDIVAWDPPDVAHPPELTLRVACSKGTYVRALARDLGRVLGTGAHLAALTRTAVGPFRLEDAVPLDVLADGIHPGAEGMQPAEVRWKRYLLPMSVALCDLPHVVVDAETAGRLAHGQAVTLESLDVSALCKGRPVCCAYDEGGRLVAILRPEVRHPDDTEGDLWRPSKVFAQADHGGCTPSA